MAKVQSEKRDCRVISFDGKTFDRSKFAAIAKNNVEGNELNTMASAVKYTCEERPTTQKLGKVRARTLALEPHETRLVDKSPKIKLECIDNLCTICGDGFGW